MQAGMIQSAASLAPPEEWRIDREHSSLLFSLRHIVVHEIEGVFTRWGGAMWLDPADPTRSSVNVWIDLDSVDTCDRQRDHHIRSPEFFDVGRFPRALFNSTTVRVAGAGPSAKTMVSGRLDLHGIVRDVDLEVGARQTWRDALGVERMMLTARGRLDRQRFGLRWNQDLDIGGVVVADMIELVAYVESVHVNPR